MKILYNNGVHKVLTNHDVLINGNNALELKQIPKIDPIKLEIDNFDNVISFPLKPKYEELAQRMHIAAVQLKQYYDQVADKDEKFVPYWTQEQTFTKAREDLGEIKKRKFFESRKKFMQRNNLEERIEVYKQMSHLDVFLNRNYRKFPESMKEMGKNLRYSSMEFKFISSVAPPMLITGGYNLINMPGNSLFFVGFGYFSYCLLAFFSFAMCCQEKANEKTTFEDHAHLFLKHNSEKADDTISLIHELSE